MISVIILVYNVEKYLSKCIESVIHQTYKDLDIILVDDGSTDSCGDICDEYAKKDPRIRVIHISNSGVSVARNTGIVNALPQSEWIAFVDSDDYLEKDMYECLLEESGDSDIVECGLIKEFKDKSEVESLQKGTYKKEEALMMLLYGKIRNFAWDKLYRKELFRKIQFPAGRDCQDAAIQHKLILLSKGITIIEGNYYHYVQRGSSVTGKYKIKNHVDRWLAYYERYEFIKDLSYVKAYNNILLRSLACYAEVIWKWYYRNPKVEREKVYPMIRFIACFSRRNIPFWGFPNMSFGQRLLGVLIHSSSKISLAMAYGIFQGYMKLSQKPDNNQLFD